jgi:long-chain acyl-CoA synthetase
MSVDDRSRPRGGTRDAAGYAELTRAGGPFEIGYEAVRGVVLPVFTGRLRSLRDVLDRSACFGERTYVVQDATRLSFAEHLALADALGFALQERYGVAAGDRVALLAANRWEWLVSFWALAGIGAIPAAMNGWWTAEEIRHAAELVEPVLVIGDSPRLAHLAAAGTAVPVLDLDDDLPDLLRQNTGAAPHPVRVAEDDPAALVFTSGTTGRAKAVTVPHRSMVGFAQVNTLLEVAARAAHGVPAPASAAELAPSDDVVLVTAPLFHVSMLEGAALMAAVRGSSIVLLPGRFDPERVLRAIERERVTTWPALGSAAPRVADHAARGRYDTSSVRVLGIGGAPVSPAVQQRLRNAFPAAAFGLSMGYTSTEAGAVVARITGEELRSHPTSTGRVTPTVEVELRDGSGVPVPEGRYGEVHVRSAYLMTGYWNDPEASAAVLKDDGWLALGDVARFEDGRLHIDARARDLILVNAENVSPTEVEYVLHEHPGVDEVAVLAVDDELTGDAVCAVVTTLPGAAPTVAELSTWCRARLAHYKVPTRWHLRDEPLPRTASGKVVRRALREWVDAQGPQHDGSSPLRPGEKAPRSNERDEP